MRRRDAAPHARNPGPRFAHSLALGLRSPSATALPAPAPRQPRLPQPAPSRRRPAAAARSRSSPSALSRSRAIRATSRSRAYERLILKTREHPFAGAQVGIDEAQALTRVLKTDFALERITVKSAAEVAPRRAAGAGGARHRISS